MLLGGDAARLEEAPQQRDELGVGGRLGRAEELGADLPELAHAALLRALVAEHRAGVVELGELPVAGEAVLERRPNDARGGLRAQRDRAAALVLEGVHLLGDDVGRLADAAREDLGVLEQRRVDRLVAVAREELLGDARQVLPCPRGRGQHVGGAFGCAGVHAHGAVQPFAGVGRQAASVPRARRGVPRGVHAAVPTHALANRLHDRARVERRARTARAAAREQGELASCPRSRSRRARSVSSARHGRLRHRRLVEGAA